MAQALKTETGLNVVRTWGKYFDHGKVHLPSGAFFDRGDMLADALPDAVDRMETFLVVNEMIRLAQFAAPDLDGMPLFEHDLPASQMFIIFDRVPSLHHFDRYLEKEDEALLKVPVRALTVMRSKINVMTGPRSRVTSRIDEGELPDPSTDVVLEDGISVITWVDGAELQREYSKPDLEWHITGVGGLVPIDMTGWAFNTPWSTAEDGVEVPDRPSLANPLLPYHLGTQRQVILSLFLLMNQTIYSSRERVGRKVARRWMRAREVPDDYSVAVTRLRRMDSPHSDNEVMPDGFLSHRFFVRGHWRRLHRGTEDERAIWIKPYIKGPEDRPFIQKHRVTVMDR